MSRVVSVRPLGDGRFAVKMPDDVREFLGDLAAGLDPALDEDVPALRRLFPTAYPDDPELDAGYQVLARGELVDRRRQAIARLRATTAETELDTVDLEAWMEVVNSIRLVLGTQLDVGEDDEPPPPDGPEATTHEIYELLGMILEMIVRALSADLGPEGDDEHAPGGGLDGGDLDGLDLDLDLDWDDEG